MANWNPQGKQLRVPIGDKLSFFFQFRFKFPGINFKNSKKKTLKSHNLPFRRICH